MYRWTQQFFLDDHWLIATVQIFFSGYKDIKVHMTLKDIQYLNSFYDFISSLYILSSTHTFIETKMSNNVLCIMCSYIVWWVFGYRYILWCVTLSKHGYEIAWLIHRILCILWKFQRMYTLATSYVSLK